MATKFKKIRRFDEARAKAGVLFTPKDEWDMSHGTFKVSLYDMTTPFVQAAVENLRRTKATEIAAIADEEEKELYFFAQLFLHDWSDVFDENDKPVKFSHDEAFDYLKAEQWLARRLYAHSLNVKNFGDDPRAAKAETSGN